MKCLVLFTGGLDSQLAVRLMQDQGLEVEALYVATALCATGTHVAQAAADSLGIRLVVEELDESYCDLLCRPLFGRIGAAAPCVDCQIAKFRKARERLASSGAALVVSGEVVGQRTKSAIHDLAVAAHHAGLEGRLVRPLSARLLPATEAETQGWVDRSRLLGIQGKSRAPQLRLAAGLRIATVPPPRPDCPLLAEPLASRVEESLARATPLTSWELELLPIGRHFRSGELTRIVVARSRAESEWLSRHAERAAAAGNWLLASPLEFSGPTALIVGPGGSAACDLAARLIARFSRVKSAGVRHVLFSSPVGEQTWEVPIKADSAAERALGRPT